MSVDQDHPREADPVRGSPLATLVMRARNGDEHAWAALVERYAPLIWSICRKYRLDNSDAADAGQNVWLHLVDQLDKLRDPAALPGWLVTTTRRECERISRSTQVKHTTRYTPDVASVPDDQSWSRSMMNGKSASAATCPKDPWPSSSSHPQARRG